MDSRNNNRQSLVYMMVFVGIIILVFYAVRQQSMTSDEISIGEVAQQIISGKIMFGILTNMVIRNMNIMGTGVFTKDLKTVR